MAWPGHDEYNINPIIFNAGRPGRNRPRLSSAHQPVQAPYYIGPNGQLLVPAQGIGGRAHRAHSAAGERPPAQVIINNELQWEEHSPARRPRSYHDHDYIYDEYEDHRRERSRSRSRSRVRRRTPPPQPHPHQLHPPHYEPDFETREKLAKLEELEKREADQKRKKQIEEELFLKNAKEEADKARRKKEEEELTKKAIEKFTTEERIKAEKEKKEKEEREKEVQEGIRKTFRAKGWSEEQIDNFLKKGGKGKEPAKQALSIARPTYIRVHRKHLDPETLDYYDLPWEWDVSYPLSPYQLCSSTVTDRFDRLMKAI